MIIYASRGHKRYVGGTVRELDGKNIAADPIVVGWGTLTVPPLFSAGFLPDIDQPGDTDAERLVKVFIDDSTEAFEDKYLWVWVSDNPEVDPVRIDISVTVA